MSSDIVNCYCKGSVRWFKVSCLYRQPLFLTFMFGNLLESRFLLRLYQSDMGPLASVHRSMLSRAL